MENLSNTDTFRFESDSLGKILVSSNRYWGANTQRALQNFRIGHERMPVAIVRAFGIIKKAAALVNFELGLLPENLLGPIVESCEEVISGVLDEHFPLVIWQSGSGTQTNMNVNEVIANRANELLGRDLGSKFPVHPNDHVNLGQSSNDSFPTAMHIAGVTTLEDLVIPALTKLHIELSKKQFEYFKFVKVGRTHLMDAIPLTLGQEFSGYRAQVEYSIERIKATLLRMQQLAQGGTAVGTGLNTHFEFAQRFSLKVSELTRKKFESAPNKFEAIAAHDALVFAHGALKTTAVSLLKIANDIRWLGSGPRCGLNELILPSNEAGSSIMPGKVNPTQCEVLSMVCCQVLGNDVAINFGAANGSLELNTYKPIIIYSFLQSARLLADSVNSFVDHTVADLKVNENSLQQNLTQSLMLVTAFVPHIGYDKAAQIAQLAQRENLTLRQAALDLQYINEQEFDEWALPETMLGPHK